MRHLLTLLFLLCQPCKRHSPQPLPLWGAILMLTPAPGSQGFITGTLCQSRWRYRLQYSTLPELFQGSLVKVILVGRSWRWTAWISEMAPAKCRFRWFLENMSFCAFESRDNVSDFHLFFKTFGWPLILFNCQLIGNINGKCVRVQTWDFIFEIGVGEGRGLQAKQFCLASGCLLTSL